MKTSKMHPGALARYKACMQEPRTMKEIAFDTGNTYGGVQKPLIRMMARGYVKKIAVATRRFKYVWIGG